MNAVLQHLIVVDDEAGIRTLLANYFSRHGFRVSAVASGAELIQLMQSDPAVLVLLDLGLPAEDGFEVARRLRERWRCGLVFVTGRGDTVDRIVGLEIGAGLAADLSFQIARQAGRDVRTLRRGRRRSGFQERLEALADLRAGRAPTGQAQRQRHILFGGQAG